MPTAPKRMAGAELEGSQVRMSIVNSLAFEMGGALTANRMPSVCWRELGISGLAEALRTTGGPP